MKKEGGEERRKTEKKQREGERCLHSCSLEMLCPPGKAEYIKRQTQQNIIKSRVCTDPKGKGN